MKRSLFILLLSLCPLLLLTLGAFSDFWNVPPRKAPDDRELLENVTRVNEEMRHRISRYGELPRELAGSELFLGTAIPAAGYIKKDDAQFGNFPEDWNRWSGNAADIQKYLELLFRFKTKDITQLRRAVDDIRGFRERFAQNLPNDAQRLLQIMMNIEKDLDERVARAEKIKEAEGLMAEARNAFDAEHYELCRDKCNELLTEYDSLLELRVKASFVTLKARAEVYVDADLLSEIKLEEMDPAKRLQKITAFLRTVEDVDVSQLEESDLRQIEAFQQAEKSVRAEISADRQTDLILKMLAKLRNDPPSGISERFSAAGKTLSTIQAAEKEIRESPDAGSVKSMDRLKALADNREMLQKTVRAWFTKMVPAVSSSLDDKIQEATLKNGNVLRGYFLPVQDKDNGKITGYKCYPTLREFQNPTKSIGTHAAADFVSEPAQPYEKTLTAEYAELRKTLLAGPESRGRWVEFQNRCQKMEEELKAFRQKPGVESTDVSFVNAVSVARGVMEQENWKVVEKVFAGR